MDDKHNQNVIAQEQADDFRRALQLSVACREAMQSGRHHDPQMAVVEQTSSAMYRLDQPSNATPMERFLTLSPLTDPYYVGARQSMKEMGVGYGSFKSMNQRAILPREWAAAQAAEGNKGGSSMQVEVAHDPRSTQRAGGNHGEQTERERL